VKVLKTNKLKKKKILVLFGAKKLNETSLKEEPNREPGFEIYGEKREEKDEKPDKKPVLSSAEMREQKKK